MGIDLVGVDLVEVRHTLIAMLRRRPSLHSVLRSYETKQAPTENIKLKHIPARRNSSEGLPNDNCEISAVSKIC